MTHRILAFALAAALPSATQAHPGHIAQAGGHTHWLALAILGGLVIALLGWGIAGIARALKRRWQP